MQFKKLIKILGHQLYVDADCPKIEGIKKKIKDGINLIESKRLKDSIPNQFKPDQRLNDVFYNFFKK